MVAAGEASGTLEAVLERLADFMEDQAKLKGKVTSALAYPVLMTIIAGALVGVLMVAVVPKVTSIFANLGQELPWYTSLLIFVSDTLAGYWWLILLCIAGFIYGFRRWVATPAGRLRWDTILLRLPLFGRLNLLVAVARFARTLSTLLASGVPLLTAMDIVKKRAREPAVGGCRSGGDEFDSRRREHRRAVETAADSSRPWSPT